MEMPQKSSWRPTMEMRIGEFTAKPASNEICVNSVTTRLRPILMDVLLRLAVESGTVVSRETLLSEVWLRRMVNDEVLSRAIAELRTALGDDPKNPRYIETLPKVGYRLIAKVTTMDGAGSPRSPPV
jgi:DNA-binding winged helix-turn-helix (wHTH) protein